MQGRTRRGGIAAFVIMAALAVACGKESKPEAPATAAPATPVTGAAPAGTGRVIPVELYSDAEGNYFKPAKIEAKSGDIVRFTLKSGVHSHEAVEQASATERWGIVLPPDVRRDPTQQ